MTDKAKLHKKHILRMLDEMEEDEKLLKTVFEILHSHYIRRESDELLHPPVKGAATPEPGGVVGQIRKEDLQHA